MNIEAKNFLLELNSFFKEHGITLYLIGGIIRDAILNKNSRIKDIDIVFNFKLENFIILFESHFNKKLTVRKKFLTASYVISESLNVDFVQARNESYPVNGGLPEVEVGDFKTDINRRDFTVNTLRVSLDNFLKSDTDLTQYVENNEVGLKDINELKIRVLHSNSFIDDPTRIYRAIRYKSKIKGSFEQETELLMKKALSSDVLKTISNYRALTEFIKILSEIKFKSSIDDLIFYKIRVPYFNNKQILELKNLLDNNISYSKIEILKLFKEVLSVSNFNQCICDLNISKSVKREL